jgi:GAF domain-containing protein
VLAVPVLHDGRLAGAVEFYAGAGRVWSRFDVRQARTAGHHVAAALARANGRGAPGPAVDAFAEALDA